MSAGKSLARATVTLAARTLPVRIRNRYREQWLADLRDAGEWGVHTSEIAIGSLLFAATVSRLFASGLRTSSPAEVAHRGRAAVALALSAAILGLTQYASVGGTGESLTGNTVYDAFVFSGTTLAIAFALLAPIVAVGTVSFTRQTDPRVRLGVWLLAPVGLTQLVQARIDSGNAAIGWIYVSPGMIAYLVSFALTITAVLLVRRRLPFGRSQSPRRRVYIAVGGGFLMVASVVLSGLFAAVGLWATRRPLVFRTPVGAADRANYADWLHLKTQGEQLVGGVFWAWAILGLILTFVVIFLGIRASSVAGAILAGAIEAFATLVALGGLFGFLDLMDSGTVPTEVVGLVLFVGRCGMVGAILLSVGGRPRYSRGSFRTVARRAA